MIDSSKWHCLIHKIQIFAGITRVIIWWINGRWRWRLLYESIVCLTKVNISLIDLASNNCTGNEPFLYTLSTINTIKLIILNIINIIIVVNINIHINQHFTLNIFTKWLVELFFLFITLINPILTTTKLLTRLQFILVTTLIEWN